MIAIKVTKIVFITIYFMWKIIFIIIVHKKSLLPYEINNNVEKYLHNTTFNI